MDLYLDKDYKVDCENKFNYSTLEEITSGYSNYFFNVNKVYKCTNTNIYLIDAKTDFYTKNVTFIKKIGKDLYKAVI